VTVGFIAMAAVILLAFLRVPLGLALMTVSLAGLAWITSTTTALTLFPMTVSEAVLSYDLAVVPMVILMGNVISRTGIAQDLFRAANAYMGSVRGGLSLATMVTCAGFGSVCRSSYATAATMAKVAYPSMRRHSYSNGLASATIAAGGTLGILIPPSIIMVIYGIITQTSIGDLFVAGVLPGLLGLALYMLAILWVAWRRLEEAPKGQRSAWGERIASLRGVWPLLFLFGLIIGGLYGDLSTATEAAGIGAGMSVVVGFLQRRLTLTSLRRVILETAYTSISLYVVLFGAMMLSKLLTMSGLSVGILDLVTDLGLTGYWLIFAILVIFLVPGCVMDSMAIILIFVPLFAPVVALQGFDLVWFGIIVVVVTEIALITPPVGMNVFVLKAVLPDVPVLRIFRGLVPFIAVDIVRLGLLVAFPAISLWLVSHV
jgi:tripartite ATP-independent transporter DctM subunit